MTLLGLHYKQILVYLFLMKKLIFVIAILVAVLAFASASGADMYLFEHRTGFSPIEPIEDYNQDMLEKETYFPDWIFTDQEYHDAQTKLISFHEPSLYTDQDEGRIDYRVLWSTQQNGPIAIRVEIDPFDKTGTMFYKSWKRNVDFSIRYSEIETSMTKTQISDTWNMMNDLQFWSIPEADAFCGRFYVPNGKDENFIYDDPGFLLVESRQNGCYHMVYRVMNLESKVIHILDYFKTMADPDLMNNP